MKWRDPEEARTRLFELVSGQSGYFTAKQALEAGYSSRLQHYHTHRGHWLRIDRGIYRLREFPGSRFEDLVRWTLWSGGKAVISHDTAADVHELGDIMAGRIHLTVPPEFRKAVPAGVVLHKAWLGVQDLEQGSGFRLTTPLRTLVDLFLAHMETDRLATAIRSALDRGRVRWSQLDTAFGALGEEHQEGAHRLLAIVKEREGVLAL